MSIVPQDYVERCYAGWLGKLIGVRFGIPIEGWDYNYIKNVYGEITGYIDNYKKLLAADDDTNAPLALLSALYDYTYTSDITSEQIGMALLNTAPFEHGFFWWGGYGQSTEHTAYTNLRAGIMAPRSGSVEQNGTAVAEQIGGQIFIDPWGLIAPGQPKLAAEYAQKAAGVTHGGNGVYGGMFVAAAISAAFILRDIRKVIEEALRVIPGDCEYTRMALDIIRYHDEHPQCAWEDAFAYIRSNWGYDRYPGVCHIIPNSAVMVMSMLYGEGDFSRTICICNMCGWDTDCNVGNVATILGVMVGLEGIDMRWRQPINDAFAISTVIGCRNFADAPWCASYIANLGYLIAGQPVPEHWAPFIKPMDMQYHFELPGSTHGFTLRAEKCHMNDELQTSLLQTTDDAFTGTGSLKCVARPVNGNERYCIARRTHFRPEDFHDSRYDPSFSPMVYPGQHLHAAVKRAAKSSDCEAALYALDANIGQMLLGSFKELNEDWVQLEYDIPSGEGICIDEIGVCIQLKAGWNSTSVVLLDDFTVSGNVNYGIDFTRERNEVWYYAHREVSQFTRLGGIWNIEQGALVGSGASFAEAYTGHIQWKDIDFSATITPLMPGRTGISFRVQGAMRSYCAALEQGKLRLMKNVNGSYHCLNEIQFAYELNRPVCLGVRCRGCDIEVSSGADTLIKYTDNENPYLSGCIGASLANGGRAAYTRWDIKTY